MELVDEWGIRIYDTGPKKRGDDLFKTIGKASE